MATQYAFGKIVTSGLVLSLNAADRNSYPGSGTVWNDMSGNGNNGTLTNGPTFSSANGGSIVFDGVDDYVNCGATTQITGLIDVTVSMWHYMARLALSVPLSRYNQATLNNGFQFVSNNGSFSFGGRESAAEYLFAQTPSTYAINNWYNLVGTKQGNTWSIYVNGALMSSNNVGLGNVSFSANPLRIGLESLVNPFLSTLGRIATTQIYNRALSPSEIQQNYNALKSRFNLQ